MTFIPDPATPEMRAIDSETGELCGGLFVVMPSDLSNPHAPTLAELEQHGMHIGYTRPGDWFGRTFEADR